MKRSGMVGLFITPLCLNVALLRFAGPADAQTYEVLLVGDSWAFLMESYGIFEDGFESSDTGAWSTATP